MNLHPLKALHKLHTTEPTISDTDLDTFSQTLESIGEDLDTLFDIGLTPQQIMKGIQVLAMARQNFSDISKSDLLQLILDERSTRLD